MDRTLSLRRLVHRVSLAALVAAPLVVPATAAAQEVQGIAAVVNDEVVSVLDVGERVNFVIFSSGLENSPQAQRQIAPQVLRALIDERLILQAAKNQNVSVSETELARAIGGIEKRNKIPANRFEEFLKANGINPETIKAQLRAELAKRGLLLRRKQNSGVVTDEEVQEELERIKASQGTVQYLVSQIFLLVENPTEDTTIRRNAEQLVAQLRTGADFVAIARQFSNGVTAAQGGDMGWVQAGQLAEEVAATLATLEQGQISNPIHSGGGYVILQLRDRRQRMMARPDEVRVVLKQILLSESMSAPEAEAKTPYGLAESIRQKIKSCDDMSRMAAQIDPNTSGDLGIVRMGDLPPHLRQIVSRLRIGSISPPVETAQGIHLLMVCDRIEPEIRLPDQDEIRRHLQVKKLDFLSRRYLRDLRRDAVIDIRMFKIRI